MADANRWSAPILCHEAHGLSPAERDALDNHIGEDPTDLRARLRRIGYDFYHQRSRSHDLEWLVRHHPELELSAFETGVPDRVEGTRFGFLAFEGMTLLDLVGVLDPVSRIAGMGFDPTSTCEVISAGTGTHVWSGLGAALEVTRVRPSLADFDVLVIPGGPGARTLTRDRTLLDWLGTFPKNRLAASVCTGSLVWAAEGRLVGKRATTHASALEALASLGASVVRERVVEDEGCLTAAGVTSALDLGLALVERFTDADTRARVAAQMEMPGAAR